MKRIKSPKPSRNPFVLVMIERYKNTQRGHRNNTETRGFVTRMTPETLDRKTRSGEPFGRRW